MEPLRLIRPKKMDFVHLSPNYNAFWVGKRRKKLVFILVFMLMHVVTFVFMFSFVILALCVYLLRGSLTSAGDWLCRLATTYYIYIVGLFQRFTLYSVEVGRLALFIYM